MSNEKQQNCENVMVKGDMELIEGIVEALDSRKLKSTISNSSVDICRLMLTSPRETAHIIFNKIKEIYKTPPAIYNAVVKLKRKLKECISEKYSCYVKEMGEALDTWLQTGVFVDFYRSLIGCSVVDCYGYLTTALVLASGTSVESHNIGPIEAQKVVSILTDELKVVEDEEGSIGRLLSFWSNIFSKHDSEFKVSEIGCAAMFLRKTLETTNKRQKNDNMIRLCDKVLSVVDLLETEITFDPSEFMGVVKNISDLYDKYTTLKMQMNNTESIEVARMQVLDECFQKIEAFVGFVHHESSELVAEMDIHVKK